MPGRTPDRDLSTRLQEARNELEWLVKDAPPIPPEVQSRIWERVERKISEPTPQAVVAKGARWLPVVRIAAAVVLMMGLSGAVLSQTALGREHLWPLLMRFVPGSAFVSSDANVRTLAAPVSVTYGSQNVTVLALVADSARTEVRLQLKGWSTGDAGLGSMADFEETALLLPDGSAQRPDQYFLRSTQEDVSTLILSFPPLPVNQEQVQIRLPLSNAAARPVELTLSLRAMHTEAAGGSELPAVVRSVDGTEVRLHAVFLQEDGIYLPVGFNTLESGRSLLGVETRPDRSPYLLDDRGFPYSLDLERSDSLQHGERPATLVFTPRLQDWANSLHLVVPSLLIQETGQADLSIQVGDLAPGDRITVNQALDFGRLTIQVTELERVDERRFRLYFEPQDDREPGASKRRWVGFRSVLSQEVPVTATVVNHVVNGVSTTHLDIDLSELVEPLSLHLEDPILSQTGPWELEVPLTGE